MIQAATMVAVTSTLQSQWSSPTVSSVSKAILYKSLLASPKLFPLSPGPSYRGSRCRHRSRGLSSGCTEGLWSADPRGPQSGLPALNRRRIRSPSGIRRHCLAREAGLIYHPPKYHAHLYCRLLLESAQARDISRKHPVLYTPLG